MTTTEFEINDLSSYSITPAIGGFSITAPTTDNTTLQFNATTKQWFWGPGLGPVGPVGTKGLIGLTGDTGATGQNGATGPVGPVGPTGDQGSVGQQGLMGNPGAAGSNGSQGNPGNPGANATGYMDLSSAQTDTGTLTFTNSFKIGSIGTPIHQVQYGTYTYVSSGSTGSLIPIAFSGSFSSVPAIYLSFVNAPSNYQYITLTYYQATVTGFQLFTEIQFNAPGVPYTVAWLAIN